MAVKEKLDEEVELTAIDFGDTLVNVLGILEGGKGKLTNK